MKLAIMQPYFFPYLGYFQLINAVDKYLIYDDVNFIKGGWINRNRILLNGSAFMINVPMIGASSFKKINEIMIGAKREKVLPTIVQAYRKSPYFSEVIDLISEIILFDNDNLSKYLANSIVKISNFLQIETEFLTSSEILKNNELKSQDKIIFICKVLGSNEYINSIGGKKLYEFNIFEENDIKLNFLNPIPIEYKQFNNDFIPNLSIIDVLMHCGKERTKYFLNQYTLI